MAFENSEPRPTTMDGVNNDKFETGEIRQIDLRRSEAREIGER